jgi:hypothetical protein
MIYRKILNTKDVETLQTDMDRLGDWAEENNMKINPNKSKALSFTIARVKDPLNYSLEDLKIPEASICKYLGIIIRSDLSSADQVNYTAQKARRALNFVMHIVKKREIKIRNFIIYVTSTSHSRIWGGVLESIQGMLD